MQELIEDTLVAGGMRRRRWVSDGEPLVEPPFEGDLVIVKDEAVGLLYSTMMGPYRGPVEVHFGRPIHPDPAREDDWIRVLAWAINGEKVSRCMQEGAAAYAEMVGRWPGVAYIQKMPEGAEYGVEVDGVMLLEVGWVLPGFLYIGG